MKRGAFAAVGVRWAEVVEYDCVGIRCRLRWLDDGKWVLDGRWFEGAELASVVASRTDLVEEHSHIRVLGEAISGSKVQRLCLANCELSAATLTTFVQSVSWETVMLTSIDVSDNRLDEAACQMLPGAAGADCEVIIGDQMEPLSTSPAGWFGRCCTTSHA